jgi:hypothetical protein
VIEADVRTYLLDQPPVAALIDDRCYPERLPQNAALPAVTFRRVFGTEGITHDGPSGLGRSRLQFDCWATTYGEVLGVSGAIRSALRAYPETRIVNVMDAPEPEIALRRRMIEVSLWHQED